MKVKAIASSMTNAPIDVLQAGWSTQSQVFVTIGREYEVHALVFAGNPEYRTPRPRILGFQIVNDIDSPSFYPTCLFEVVDRTLPHDWECNLFPPGNFLIGPRFIIESTEAFDAMSDKEPDAMRKFRSRLQDIEAERRKAEEYT